MVVRTPLILVSGCLSQLFPGDTVPGTDTVAQASGNVAIELGITALSSGNAALSLGTTALASGNAALIVSETALSSGNAALVVGSVAQASGNSALELGNTALASGNAALVLSSVALASGNAALTVGSVAQASGNAALGAASVALASGNAGIALASAAMPKSGGTFTGDVIFGTTSATQLPVGTTAQRPSASTGLVRFNTSINLYEGYDGANWIPFNSDIINVKDFGAVGDGVADDTAAIQAAIDYAKEYVEPASSSQALRNDRNRCKVFLPSGAYKVTSTLVVDGPGVHIMGAGVAGTIVRSTINDDLFSFASSLQTTTGNIQNIAVSDLSLRGDYVDPTQGAGIRIGVAKHVYIYNVFFNGFYEDLVFEGTQEPTFVSNCNFFSNNSVTTTRTGNAHIRLSALVVNPGSSNAMAGPDGSGTYYAYPVSIMISNCEIRTAAGYKEFGIYAGACDGLYVTNCHMLNHKESIRISRSTAVTPCANIRIQDTFFDGELPTTLRNVYLVSTQGNLSALAVSDVTINHCKFNGVGDNSTGVDAWIILEDTLTRGFSVTNSYFDKALSESAASVEIKKGNGYCVISNNTFLLEQTFVPTVLIRSNASNQPASGIFSNLVIDSNKILCSSTLERPDFNIRLANAQNNTVISNNVYYAASGVGGDGLLYDTKTSGTTYGSGTSNNNILIS